MSDFDKLEWLNENFFDGDYLSEFELGFHTMGNKKI